MAAGDLVVLAGPNESRIYRMVGISPSVRDQITSQDDAVGWMSGYSVGSPPSSENLLAARQLGGPDLVDVRYGFSQTSEIGLTSGLDTVTGLAWDGTNVVEGGYDTSNKVAVHQGVTNTIQSIYTLGGSETLESICLDASGNLVAGFTYHVNRYQGVSSTLTDSLTFGPDAIHGVAIDRTSGDLVLLVYDGSQWVVRRYAGFSTTLSTSFALPFQWLSTSQADLTIQQAPPIIAHTSYLSAGGTLALSGDLVAHAANYYGQLASGGALERRVHTGGTTGSLSSSGGLSLLPFSPLSAGGSLPPSGTLHVQAAHGLAHTLPLAGNLGLVQSVSHIVQGSVSPAGNLDRRPQTVGGATFGLNVGGALTWVGSEGRANRLSLAGGLAPNGVTSVPANAARVSQLATHVVAAPSQTVARVSQLATHVALKSTADPARVSQLVAHAAVGPAPTPARVSQLVVQVAIEAHKFAYAIQGQLDLSGQVGTNVFTRLSADILPLAGVLVTGVGRGVLQRFLIQTGALVTTAHYRRAADGTATPVGQVAIRRSQPADGSLASYGALSQQTNIGLDGNLASQGSLTQAKGKTLQGQLMSVAVVGTLLIRGPRQVQNQATLPLSGKLSAHLPRALAGFLLASGGLARQSALPMTGEAPLSGTLTRLVSTSANGTAQSSAALRDSISKALSGDSTLNGDAITQSGLKVGLASDMAVQGTLDRLANLKRTYQGTLPLAGQTTPHAGPQPTGTLGTSGALRPLTWKYPAGSLSPSGSLGRGRAFEGTLTTDGGRHMVTRTPRAGILDLTGELSLITSFGHVFLERNMRPSGGQTRRTSTTRTGVLDGVGTLSARSTGSVTLPGQLTMIGALSATYMPRLTSSLSGVISKGGTVLKRVARPLAGGLSAAGGVPGVLGRALSGVLQKIGDLVALFTGSSATKIMLVMETEAQITGLVMETEAQITGLVMETDDDLTLTMDHG